MSSENGTHVKVADMIDACDVLADLADRYSEQIEAERPAAEEFDDPRYLRRITKAADELIELSSLLDDVYEMLGLLRHNHEQLKWARQGKMV